MSSSIDQSGLDPLAIVVLVLFITTTIIVGLLMYFTNCFQNPLTWNKWMNQKQQIKKKETKTVHKEKSIV